MSNCNSPRAIAIILAGGKGKRMNSKTKNKTSLPFLGQPILTYGLKLFSQTADRIVVVKGAYSNSVQAVIDQYPTHQQQPILTTVQRKRLGTGHAAIVANRFIQAQQFKPELVFVGYGDHLMFYKPAVINRMSARCHDGVNQKVAVVMVVAEMPDPTGLGRVIYDKNRCVQKIVEEKNATPEEKKLTTINAGLYCFNYDFFNHYLSKLKKNTVSQEYYLTDLIEFAVRDGWKVLAELLPYQEVGIGINTQAEKAASEQLYAELSSH